MQCANSFLNVFTLQSIKSRIETNRLRSNKYTSFQFLLYSPLNQGLKPNEEAMRDYYEIMFLLYSPLNQGLKLSL